MKTFLSIKKIIITITISTLCYSFSKAQEGYFTTYGSKIEKGKLEFSFMSDHTSPSFARRGEGQRNYLSQMPELEYHPTDKLAIEFMTESFLETETGIAKFTGFRFETRYRLFKKNVPLNPAIYVEYEDLDPETRFKMEVSGWIIPPYQAEEVNRTRERVLESRIILSQDIGSWNFSFNWISETERTGIGGTAFGYAMGAMYYLTPGGSENEGREENPYTCPMHPEINSSKPDVCPKCSMTLIKKERQSFFKASTLTFELFGALGNNKAFALMPGKQEHYFQPGIMLHLPHAYMLNVGFAIGLSNTSDDMVRLMLMKEF